MVYDQTPNENLITHNKLFGTDIENAYKTLKYTGFNEETGEPTGYKNDPSTSRLLGLGIIGGLETPQMIEKSYRGVASLGIDTMSKGGVYSVNELLKRGGNFVSNLTEQAGKDPFGTVAEMVGVTGGAAAVGKAGKTAAHAGKYATGTYNLDAIGSPGVMVTTTSPLNKLTHGFGGYAQDMTYAQRTTPSTRNIQYEASKMVGEIVDPDVKKYTDKIINVQLKSKPDVSGFVTVGKNGIIERQNYLDMTLKGYGKHEVAEAGLNVDFAKYAVPSTSGAAQTLTHLGDKNTNWLIPSLNNYVKTLSPTLAGILPKTGSSVSMLPVNNIQSASKPLIGDVIGEITRQSSGGKGYDISTMSNAMIKSGFDTGLGKKDGLHVAPSPKTTKRSPSDFGEVEPEFFAVSMTPKVKVDKTKKVGVVPETGQKLYSVIIDGKGYAKSRLSRAKENVLGARVDLQTTLRGIPDGRLYNKNSLKFFENEATPAGLSKFSALDEIMTDTRHGKEHVLNVEDNAVRLTQKDKKYKNVDLEVVRTAARLHDTLRTLDYDGITRGSHAESMSRMMKHGEIKTSKEYLDSLKPADAASLQNIWNDNAGVKLWDETVTSYRKMTPSQQKKVRNAIGLHTAAKSNIRTSLFMPKEARVISDADRLELARFYQDKADWLPKQRKMFTSKKVQQEILAEKYGKTYATSGKKGGISKDNIKGVFDKDSIKEVFGKDSTKGKSALQNAGEGALNFVEGMITPSGKMRAANPHEVNIYDSYKASYKGAIKDLSLPANFGKSASYVGGNTGFASNAGFAGTAGVGVPVTENQLGYQYNIPKPSGRYKKPYEYQKTTEKSKNSYDYQKPSKKYEYSPKKADYEYLAKSKYEYSPKRGVYDYSPKGTSYDYSGKVTNYEYAPKISSYDYSPKTGNYEYLGKANYEYNGGYTPPGRYSAPYGRSVVYGKTFKTDDILKINPYKHDYPEKGRKRKKQTIKAVEVYHREVKDPLEVLEWGSATSPYLKETYPYKGNVTTIWDTKLGNTITNTLRRPKNVPKSRVVIKNSPLDRMIRGETQNNKRRALRSSRVSKRQQSIKTNKVQRSNKAHNKKGVKKR